MGEFFWQGHVPRSVPTHKGHASFTLPKELVDEVDRIVAMRSLGFRSRSELIANAVRGFIEWHDNKWEDQKKQMRAEFDARIRRQELDDPDEEP